MDEFFQNDVETYYFYAKQILDEIADISRGIRLLGITLTNLTDQNFQEVSLPLFKHSEWFCDMLKSANNKVLNLYW